MKPIKVRTKWVEQAYVHSLQYKSAIALKPRYDKDRTLGGDRYRLSQWLQQYLSEICSDILDPFDPPDKVWDCTPNYSIPKSMLFHIQLFERDTNWEFRDLWHCYRFGMPRHLFDRIIDAFGRRLSNHPKSFVEDYIYIHTPPAEIVQKVRAKYALKVTPKYFTPEEFSNSVINLDNLQDFLGDVLQVGNNELFISIIRKQAPDGIVAENLIGEVIRYVNIRSDWTPLFDYLKTLRYRAGKDIRSFNGFLTHSLSSKNGHVTGLPEYIVQCIASPHHRIPVSTAFGNDNTEEQYDFLVRNFIEYKKHFQKVKSSDVGWNYYIYRGALWMVYSKSGVRLDQIVIRNMMELKIWLRYIPPSRTTNAFVGGETTISDRFLSAAMMELLLEHGQNPNIVAAPIRGNRSGMPSILIMWINYYWPPQLLDLLVECGLVLPEDTKSVQLSILKEFEYFNNSLGKKIAKLMEYGLFKLNHLSRAKLRNSGGLHQSVEQQTVEDLLFPDNLTPEMKAQLDDEFLCSEPM